MKNKNFVNSDEIEKFDQYAESWWNPDGKMKSLHWINPVRVSHICEQICEQLGLDSTNDKPLKGLKILDVGCGAGLLSESMAILGADVVGIDATEKLIKVATHHAKKSGLKIEYLNDDVSVLAEKKQKFDIVLCMEVIEHVDNPDEFIRTCNKCVKDDGLLFVSTLNRTLKSYGAAIIGAEYILRWLPRGTHEWHKFLKPSEICEMLSETAKPVNMKGMVYKPFSHSWEMGSDMDVNYTIVFKK